MVRYDIEVKLSDIFNSFKRCWYFKVSSLFLNILDKNNKQNQGEPNTYRVTREKIRLVYYKKKLSE